MAVVPATSTAQAATGDYPHEDITTSGPLTKIGIGADLSCQVGTSADSNYEFYGPNEDPADCGTFISVGGQLYGPDFANHDYTATGSLGSYTPFTLIHQSPISGTGTATDPYVINTIVAAGTTGIDVSEADVYSTGDSQYETEVDVFNTNTSGPPISFILYHAEDGYLTNDDSGYGTYDPATGAIGERTASGARTLQLVPVGAGSRYMESTYDAMWAAIGSNTPLPNSCDCGVYEDEGAGLSWSGSVSSGQPEHFDYNTSFGFGSTFTTVATSPSGLHADDVIPSGQPVGAFLDPSNTSGAAGSYDANVDFGAGGGSELAQVIAADPNHPCPASLNDPSNAGCFLIVTSGPEAPYPQAGSYSITVSETDLSDGDAGTATTPVGIANAHYQVELRAWIPFAQVVDPLNPTFLSPAAEALALGWPTCGMPLHLFSLPLTAAFSTLAGDSHAGFAGTFRVDTTLNFDWTGSAIVNPQIVGTAGVSHRNITYVLVKKTWSCVMSKQATMSTSSGGTTSGASGTSFSLAYSSATPLVPGAPTIDGYVNGSFSPDGSITLSFQTDGFPSHGLAIQRDGSYQQVDILNDVSCLGQSGVLGAGALIPIARGLTGLVTSAGTLFDSPSQTGVSGVDQQSGLC